MATRNTSTELDVGLQYVVDAAAHAMAVHRQTALRLLVVIIRVTSCLSAYSSVPCRQIYYIKGLYLVYLVYVYWLLTGRKRLRKTKIMNVP